MVESFSLDEIRDICFVLGVNFENLSGDTLREKVRELYLKLERNGRIEKLVAECHRRRPNTNWIVT